MAHIFIFGLGYSGNYIAERLRNDGWSVSGTGGNGSIEFADGAAVRAQISLADEVLSTIPPVEDADIVLANYGDVLAGKSLNYLSSTGVYGDTLGAWVDESAPIVGLGGTGRRGARANADKAWLEMGARVFRLPGIYGPGRSLFDRLASGKARRIDLPKQVFSRVHVEDIASGIHAAISLNAPAGAYNLADNLPTSQNAVIEEACRLLGQAPPSLLTLNEVDLSPAARGFYEENRRIANGKAKRILGWQPQYPTFREGLADIHDQHSAR